MILRDWMLILSTLSAGILLGRQMRPETQLASPSSPERSMPKLTREDVICLIEDNGGPDGLDLSHYDLSGLNLRNLDLRGIIFSTYKVGSRLHQSANLSNTNFTDSNLTRANLAFTDLHGASFWQASLYEAYLLGVRAQDASFSQSDMRRATMFGARLNGASFWRTKLAGANLNAAHIADADMTEIDFGEGLLQEDEAAYQEYFDRWYVQDLPDKYRTRNLGIRFQQAAEIYMNLKNAYLSHGRYREASWAYLKERRMRRATLAPWRANNYYGVVLEENPQFFHLHWVWFHFKYFWLWLFDWFTDISSGYGEKPLRTLWIGMLIVLAFPVLYWWSGQIALVDDLRMQWIDYLIYSLGAFTTMDFARFETTGWVAEAIASTEALLGISILALMMFALGNRISRS
ncbi:MAG: pentapeptide repeat-containing protein [Anaerolineae bacterium]|nr:pentapeptide repeat-containing protein [Anaerolineae bacterium]